MDNDKRIVEIYINGDWHEVDFEELSEGDRFRLFDNGEKVVDPKGKSEWIASSEVFKNKYGDLVVNTY